MPATSERLLWIARYIFVFATATTGQLQTALSPAHGLLPLDDEGALYFAARGGWNSKDEAEALQHSRLCPSVSTTRVERSFHKVKSRRPSKDLRLYDNESSASPAVDCIGLLEPACRRSGRGRMRLERH
jgi:hypothetical protein